MDAARPRRRAGHVVHGKDVPPDDLDVRAEPLPRRAGVSHQRSHVDAIRREPPRHGLAEHPRGADDEDPHQGAGPPWGGCTVAGSPPTAKVPARSSRSRTAS